MPPVFIRDDRAAAVDGLTALLVSAGMTPTDAEEMAEESSLVGPESAVRSVLEAYETIGIEELVIDQPGQLDDETLERLAALIRAG
jgi:hypothetical protein